MGTDDVEVNAAAWDRRVEGGAVARAWSEGPVARSAGADGRAIRRRAGRGRGWSHPAESGVSSSSTGVNPSIAMSGERKSHGAPAALRGIPSAALRLSFATESQIYDNAALRAQINIKT